MFLDRKIGGIHDFSEKKKKKKNHLSSCGLNHQNQKSEKNGDVSRPKS